MRAAFYTLGCKVNQYETELMREDLIKNGFDVVGENDMPDVFIINSCTVTSESDRKTRQMVRKYRNLLPNAIIILTGCMPQAFPEDAANLNVADIILGNATNYELIESIKEFLITQKKIIKIEKHEKEYIKSSIEKFNGRTKAFLKIEDGCDRFCSYCIIPYARGRVRSKPIENIINEVKTLGSAGYKEVVLLGINLSAYGKEKGLNLADAVEAAASVESIERIRLGSMEPDQFTDEVIERLAKVDKLCPQFHLSLQSGCDRTLKVMNRHYNTAFYETLINKLRNCFKNCSITTDIMVGFAGETDEDFEKSVEFLRKIGFSKANVFAYSRRKGTKADLMSGQVSNIIKHERSRQMIAAANETQHKFLEAQIGGVYPVLYENRTKDGYFEGYTPNYTLVKLSCDDNPCGKIINTRLISILKDGCIGEII